MRLVTKCGCELASVYQLSELSSIFYLLNAWAGAGRGEAGLVWFVLIESWDRRHEAPRTDGRSESDTCTPPSHHHTGASVILLVSHSVVSLGRLECAVNNNGWLVCTSELWWPRAYIENEMKSVTCRT